MKYFSLLLLVITLTACSPKNIIRSVMGSGARTPVSAETLEDRYQVLWSAVEKDRALPKLVAHIGASTRTETAVWVLTEDRVFTRAERNWTINCGAGPQPDIRESIYDPVFRVAYLRVDREGMQQERQPCSIHLGSNKASIILPKRSGSAAEEGSFSFLAYSCNQFFSTKIREEKTGILARDLSLWLRMQGRVAGENSQGQVPFTPEFVLGLGDQIYVDPDPGEPRPIAFFGGKKSNEWLVEHDESSLQSMFRTVYRYTFSAPVLSGAFSALPSKMMWDDHEIRDGWGSHGDEKTGAWPDYFRVARHAFIANQHLRSYAPGTIDQKSYDALVAGNASLHQHFKQGKKTHFLMLDSRSMRNAENKPSLFDPDTALHVEQWLKSGASEMGDLYVLTVGTPLFPSSRIEGKKFKLFEQTEVADDLRDAWGHQQNEAARERLVKKLVAHFSTNLKDRLLVLSGDVHFSSLHYLSLNGRVFGQEVVTSGIAHALKEEVMIANFFSHKDKEVAGVVVTPAGRVNHSATFAEVIVHEKADSETPEVALVFHSNGHKTGNVIDALQGKRKWVLANTNLLAKGDSSMWYHRYQYGELKIKPHLRNIPPNVKPAGLIIPLDFPNLPKLNKITKKQNILSGIQGQSIFCTVNNTDYEETLATDWTLEGLSSCEARKPPFEWAW